MAAGTLITGATGMIARSVLAAWQRVDGPVLDPVLIGVRSDLMDPTARAELLERLRPQRVLHLAWTASSTPGYRDDPRNALWVEATVGLALACLEREIQFIGTGSIAELHPDRDPYSRAKSDTASRLRPLMDADRITWLRPHFVYSIEQRQPGLVAAALAARDEGRAFAPRTPGERHDFVDVADVARAILVVLRGGLAGRVEIGSGRTRSAADVASAIGAVVAVQGGEGTDWSTPAADIQPLTDQGWAPMRTRELFHDQPW